MQQNSDCFLTQDIVVSLLIANLRYIESNKAEYIWDILQKKPIAFLSIICSSLNFSKTIDYPNNHKSGDMSFRICLGLTKIHLRLQTYQSFSEYLIS